MTRDYTDYMNMTANELAQYARENANGSDLLAALADMLDATVETVADYDAVNDALIDANQRAESWREEAMAIQRQLDMVRG